MWRHDFGLPPCQISLSELQVPLTYRYQTKSKERNHVAATLHCTKDSSTEAALSLPRHNLVHSPSLLAIFVHLVFCLTTRPKPLPKRALHIVRSRASSFKWEYPLLSLWSSSSFLRLFPRLPVTSILPIIFPSITRCRRQFLRKMWPIQLAFRLLISCRIFLC